MKTKTKILLIICGILVIAIGVSIVKLKDVKVISKIEDIKNDLGNGTNGNIIDIEKGNNEEGNETYTVTYKDGEKTVITIRPIDHEDEVLYLDEESDISEDFSGEDKKEKDPIEYNPEITYEMFNSLSEKDKQAFIDSFKNIEEFYSWLSKAKEDDKESDVPEEPPTEIEEEEDHVEEDPVEEEPGTAYGKYNLLTVEEKQIFIESFNSPEEFYAWYAKAKEEYEKLHEPIVVEDGKTIDLSSY